MNFLGKVYIWKEELEMTAVFVHQGNYMSMCLNGAYESNAEINQRISVWADKGYEIVVEKLVKDVESIDRSSHV